MTESRPLPECAHFPPRSERVMTRERVSQYGIISQVGRCRSYIFGLNSGGPKQCGRFARRGQIFCHQHNEWETGDCKVCRKWAREYRRAKTAAERDQIWRLARRSNLDPDKTVALIRRTARFMIRQNGYSLSGGQISPANIKEWEERGELPIPRPTSGHLGTIG